MSESEPHIEKIRRQFTRQADVYTKMVQTRDEKGLRGLVALAGVSKADRIVDVACGPGFLTMAFAEQCEHATGVDATDELLGGARKEAGRRSIVNVSFVRGDANALELPAGAFALASCRAAFHHFPDPAAVLAQMQRIVAPGGKVLIADLFSSEDSEKASYHNRIERLCDPTHTRALTQPEFDRLFEAAGLEVVHRVSSEIHYDVEEWMAHGGPTDAIATEICDLFEASCGEDRSGLKVRREDDRLMFTHQAGAYLLRTPLA
jgi:ubiquinone/menaquinone biosynthesis C-methylase UbiE